MFQTEWEKAILRKSHPLLFFSIRLPQKCKTDSSHVGFKCEGGVERLSKTGAVGSSTRSSVLGPLLPNNNIGTRS